MEFPIILTVDIMQKRYLSVKSNKGGYVNVYYGKIERNTYLRTLS